VDVMNLLSIEQWLAILRIGVGLWWVKSFLHKPHAEFVSGQMSDWSLALADNHPIPSFGRSIRRVIEPSKSWMPYLILGAELAIGIGLVLGLLTPIALVGALLLNLNYLSLAGVRPRDLSVNKAWQCEQGQNWNMIVAQVVMLFTAAWSVWSLDHLLGLFGA